MSVYSDATDQQVETMFPSAAATSKYLKSGMTLTQVIIKTWTFLNPRDFTEVADLI